MLPLAPLIAHQPPPSLAHLIKVVMRVTATPHRKPITIQNAVQVAAVAARCFRVSVLRG